MLWHQRLIKGRQYYCLDSFKNEKLRGIFLNISQHDRAKRPQKNVKITRPLKKKWREPLLTIWKNVFFPCLEESEKWIAMPPKSRIVRPIANAAGTCVLRDPKGRSIRELQRPFTFHHPAYPIIVSVAAFGYRDIPIRHAKAKVAHGVLSYKLWKTTGTWVYC